MQAINWIYDKARELQGTSPNSQAANLEVWYQSPPAHLQVHD